MSIKQLKVCENLGNSKEISLCALKSTVFFNVLSGVQYSITVGKYISTFFWYPKRSSVGVLISNSIIAVDVVTP